MRNRSVSDKKKRVRPEVKQEPLISSLSEVQQITMGFRNPRRVVPNFAKTAEEREKYKKVHSSAKGPTGGVPTHRRTEPVCNLILHVLLDDHNTKTTHCFKAKQSEIGYIKSTFFKANTITKGWFAGRPLDL